MTKNVSGKSAAIIIVTSICTKKNREFDRCSSNKEAGFCWYGQLIVLSSKETLVYNSKDPFQVSVSEL